MCVASIGIVTTRLAFCPSDDDETVEFGGKFRSFTDYCDCRLVVITSYVHVKIVRPNRSSISSTRLEQPAPCWYNTIRVRSIRLCKRSLCVGTSDIVPAGKFRAIETCTQMAAELTCKLRTITFPA